LPVYGGGFKFFIKILKTFYNDFILSRYNQFVILGHLVEKAAALPGGKKNLDKG
jgi:hypothetical protein